MDHLKSKLVWGLSVLVVFTNIGSVRAGCEEPGYLAKTYPLLVPADAENAKANSLVLVSPSHFRAAQPGVGKILTEDKSKKLSQMNDVEICRTMAEGDIDKNGKRKPAKIAKAVVRKGEIWLIDGNHMAHSMDKAGKGPMLVEVIENWSSLTDKEFEAKMIQKRYCYLKDISRGKTLGLLDLPKSVLAQDDEPYRTLAEYAQDCAKDDASYQKRCGKTPFAKSKVPFTEFIWGDFVSQDPKVSALMSARGYHLPAKTSCSEPVVKLALQVGCQRSMDEGSGKILQVILPSTNLGPGKVLKEVLTETSDGN